MHAFYKTGYDIHCNDEFMAISILLSSTISGLGRGGGGVRSADSVFFSVNFTRHGAAFL